MKINTNSWHYKVFKGTYLIYNNKVPEQSDLCSYFWRTFLFSWLWYYPTFLLLMALYIFVLSPIALLFGGYPTFDFSALENCLGSYPLPRAYGWTFYPAVLVLPILFVWLNITAFSYHWINFLIVEGTLFAIVLIATPIIFLEESDTGKTFKAFLSAKKQGICPLIKFSDKEQD